MGYSYPHSHATAHIYIGTQGGRDLKGIHMTSITALFSDGGLRFTGSGRLLRKDGSVGTRARSVALDPYDDLTEDERLTLLRDLRTATAKVVASASDQHSQLTYILDKPEIAELRHRYGIDGADRKLREQAMRDLNG